MKKAPLFRMSLLSLMLCLVLAPLAALAQSLNKTQLRESYRRLNALREVYAKATKTDAKGALKMRTRIDETMLAINAYTAGKAKADKVNSAARTLLAEAQQYNTDNAKKTAKEAQGILSMGASASSATAKATPTLTPAETQAKLTAKPAAKATTKPATKETEEYTASEPTTDDSGTDQAAAEASPVSDSMGAEEMATAETTPETEEVAGEVTVEQQAETNAAPFLLWLGGLFLAAIIVIGAILLRAFRQGQRYLVEQVQTLNLRVEALENQNGSGPVTQDPTFLKADFNRRMEQLENNTLSILEQLEQRINTLEQGKSPSGSSFPNAMTQPLDLSDTQTPAEQPQSALTDELPLTTLGESPLPKPEPVLELVTADTEPMPPAASPSFQRNEVTGRIHEAFRNPARTNSFAPLNTIAGGFIAPETLASPAPTEPKASASKPVEAVLNFAPAEERGFPVRALTLETDETETTEIRAERAPEAIPAVASVTNVNETLPVFQAEARTGLAASMEALSAKTTHERARMLIDSLLPGILVAEETGKMEALDKTTFARLLQVAHLCAQREQLHDLYENIKQAAYPFGFVIEDRMVGRQAYSDVYAENLTLEDYKVSSRMRGTDFPEMDHVLGKLDDSPVMLSAVKNTVLFTLRPTVLLVDSGVKSVLQKGVYLVRG